MEVVVAEAVVAAGAESAAIVAVVVGMASAGTVGHAVVLCAAQPLPILAGGR